MELGTFSVSLAVKNIVKSKQFYEVLGFKALPSCGSVEEKWLIMEKAGTVIGLFEGMFEDNILTFNPKDVRAVQAQLKQNGFAIDTEVQSDSGPGHCIVRDPDGNLVMFDQL